MIIKLGVIGYKNHAARILNLIEKRSDCTVQCIYHPEKKINHQNSTTNFSDLLVCDAVFILSPDHTHFKYIQKLDSYNGYIFCEKPPVVSVEELEKLEQITLEKKQKLFFNFNYRFSSISDNIKNNLNSKNIGKISHVNIISTKGLAYKKEYSDSWRANKKNLHNLLNTVTIHYVDLLNFHLGKIENLYYFPSLVSENGDSYDTCFLSLKYNTGVTASIFNSYAAPYVNEISLIGTNGFLTIRNDSMNIYSPRDTFNSQGYFISPPTTSTNIFNMEKDYDESLRKSLDYFISIIKDQKQIDITHFNSSLSVNKLLLDLHNHEG